VVALLPHTCVAHVNIGDLAKFYVAGLTHPEVFNGKELNIAFENLTAQEVAAVLFSELGHKFPVHHISTGELADPRYYRPYNEVDLMVNEIGMEVTPEELAELKSFEIPVGTFADYVADNKEAFLKTYGLS
jgi:hypothetical protein